MLLQAPVAPAPTSFTVDCNAGQKIGDMLAQVAGGTAPVTIDVKGTCHESVTVTRDNVTLTGGQGGFVTSSGTAITVDGARHVHLVHLDLGAPMGLWVGDGATFQADWVHATGSIQISGASSGAFWHSAIDNGLRVDNGFVDVHDGTITHGDWTTVSCRGGSLSLEGVTVADSPALPGTWPADGIGAWGTCTMTISGGASEDNAGFGVAAWEGASIDISGGAVIQNNGRGGALAQSGGSLWISDSTVRGNHEQGVSGYMGGHVNVSRSKVENNSWSGITLTGGSSGGIDGTTISGNGGNGVDVQDTSVLTGNGGANTITGNDGWGIWCAPPPAVAQLGADPHGVETVSGNAAGEVSCPNAP